MNYGFASGNDPSSDHRNNTELKTKRQKAIGQWTLGKRQGQTDERSEQAQLPRR